MSATFPSNFRAPNSTVGTVNRSRSDSRRTVAASGIVIVGRPRPITSHAAGSQCLDHRRSRAEAAGDRQGNVAGNRSDCLGVLEEICLSIASALLLRFTHHGRRFITATADLDEIDGLFGQRAHYFSRLVFRESTSLEISRVEFDRHRESRSNGRAYAPNDFDQKASSTLRISTPLVRPLIGQRRKKLRNKITVRCVYLHATESGGLGDASSFRELVDDLVDLSGREFSRRRHSRNLQRDRARGDRSTSAGNRVGLPPWVVQLHPDLGRRRSWRSWPRQSVLRHHDRRRRRHCPVRRSAIGRP